MRILVAAYKFGSEREIGEHLGTYHYFIQLLRLLVKQGHQIMVVAPWLSFTKCGSREFDGLKIFRSYPPLWNNLWAYPFNRLMRFWYMSSTQRKIFACAKKYHPQVVMVWQARETGYALATLKHKLNLPFIFRQITTWQWHFARTPAQVFGRKKWYRALNSLKLNIFADRLLEFLLDKKSQASYARAIYKFADKVVFVSQTASREAIDMGLAKDKIEILPVAIETDLFKPLGNKPALRRQLGLQAAQVILFIGRINFAEKGLGYLLQSMPRVISSLAGVKLAIIGDGGEIERLKSLIQDLKIGPYVQLVGRQPFSSLPGYINAADVFVTPSLWLETFGQVTIEAMACGVPVVTTDAGASPEINLHQRTGLVVPAKNSAALAEAIIAILKDSERKQKYGQAARQRVLDNYTYAQVTDKLIKIFNYAQA